MSDLNMLRAITDDTASKAEPDGRWDPAEEAVSNTLSVLREHSESAPMWAEVYEAIPSAYVPNADWGDDA